MQRDAHYVTASRGWGLILKSFFKRFLFILPSSCVCFPVISVGEYKSVVQGVFAAQSCINNWGFYFKLQAGATGPTAVFSSSCLPG